jgi:hypothetical protein
MHAVNPEEKITSPRPRLGRHKEFEVISIQPHSARTNLIQVMLLSFYFFARISIYRFLT